MPVCQDAEGWQETGIQGRGARQTRCCVIHLNQVPKNPLGGYAGTYSVAVCDGRGPGLCNWGIYDAIGWDI